MTDLNLYISKLLLLSLPLPVSLKSHLLTTLYVQDLVKQRNIRYYHIPKKTIKLTEKADNVWEMPKQKFKTFYHSSQNLLVKIIPNTNPTLFQATFPLVLCSPDTLTSHPFSSNTLSFLSLQGDPLYLTAHLFFFQVADWYLFRKVLDDHSL